MKGGANVKAIYVDGSFAHEFLNCKKVPAIAVKCTNLDSFIIKGKNAGKWLKLLGKRLKMFKFDHNEWHDSICDIPLHCHRPLELTQLNVDYLNFDTLLHENWDVCGSHCDGSDSAESDFWKTNWTHPRNNYGWTSGSKAIRIIRKYCRKLKVSKLTQLS